MPLFTERWQCFFWNLARTTLERLRMVAGWPYGDSFKTVVVRTPAPERPYRKLHF